MNSFPYWYTKDIYLSVIKSQIFFLLLSQGKKPFWPDETTVWQIFKRGKYFFQTLSLCSGMRYEFKNTEIWSCMAVLWKLAVSWPAVPFTRSSLCQADCVGLNFVLPSLYIGLTMLTCAIRMWKSVKTPENLATESIQVE